MLQTESILRDALQFIVVIDVNGLLLLLDVNLLNSLVMRLGLRSGLQRILSVLLDESNKALEGAIAIIINERTATSLLELQGRETRNLEVDRRWEIVLSGLHLRTERMTVRL